MYTYIHSIERETHVYVVRTPIYDPRPESLPRTRAWLAGLASFLLLVVVVVVVVVIIIIIMI